MVSTTATASAVVHRHRSLMFMLAASVASIGGLVVACGTETEPPGPQAGDGGAAEVATVIATTAIWADVVANVACDGQVDVQTLIPVGGDPHGFEPSLANRGALGNAELVVANGLFLEEGLEDVMQAVSAEGTPVLRLAEHVADPLGYATSDATSDATGDATGDAAPDEQHRDDQQRGGLDPHVWLDPVRVSGSLDALADRLVDDVGLDRATIDACVDSYRSQLSEVDAEIVDLTATIPAAKRKLITNHDALGYFADRYGFEIVGVVIPAPSGLAETNPAQLAELASIIVDTGAPAIFAESQHSSDDAQALANASGVEVVTLATGTLGDPGSDESTYLGLLRSNAKLVSAALGGE